MARCIVLRICNENAEMLTLSGTSDFTPFREFMISAIHYIYITKFVSLGTMIALIHLTVIYSLYIYIYIYIYRYTILCDEWYTHSFESLTSLYELPVIKVI